MTTAIHTPVKIALDHKVEIYIPSLDDKGEPFSTEALSEVTDHVENTLRGWFGGTTTSEAFGTYTRDDGTIDREPIVVICAYAEDVGFALRENDIDILAEWVCAELYQESVLVTKDGRAALIFSE